MSADRQIAEAVQKLAGTHLTDEMYMLVCTVDAVDVDSRTCDCTAVTGTAVTDMPGVQLMAEVDDGMLYIPAVGSTVIVMYSKRNVPYIALYSELSAIYCVVGNTTLDITNGLIRFNDGAFGGLTKTLELKAQLQKTNDLLTQILNVLTGTVITETGNGAPSALQAALKAAIAGYGLGDYSNIENKSITHGS